MTEKLLLDMANAITELPIGVKAGGRLFFIYPPSFGTTVLISKMCKDAGLVDINEKELSILEMLKLFRNQKELVASVLAACSFEDRKQACIDDLLQERASQLKGVNIKEVAGLLISLLSINKQLTRFCEESGINEESRLKKRILDLKNKDKSSITFGGNTLYGRIFAQACEKFHWTLDYAVWGVSFVNLNMMLIDAQSSVFLTEEEKRTIKLPQEITETINADDPNKVGDIERFLSDA